MNKKQKGTVTVLVTQCIVCAVILLLGLLVRFVGGGFAEEAQKGLFAALADNTFADALFDPPTVPTNPTATTTATATATTTVTGTTKATSAVTTQTVGEKRSVAAMAPTAKQSDADARATEFPSPVCLPLKSGTLTSGFGAREHPVRGGESVHTGWDIAAEEGTPLLAMYAATVTETGSGGSYGNYLEMQVTETFSVIYAHCQKLLVKKGDKVTAGQTVARVGSTGVSTGNHLHLEFLENDTPLDPALVMPFGVYGG